MESMTYRVVRRLLNVMPGFVEGLMWSLPGWGVVCLPKGVTTEQGLKVLVKYMEDHPEELHDRTAELAFRAFVKAWPCSR